MQPYGSSFCEIESQGGRRDGILDFPQCGHPARHFDSNAAVRSGAAGMADDDADCHAGLVIIVHDFKTVSDLARFKEGGEACPA